MSIPERVDGTPPGWMPAQLPMTAKPPGIGPAWDDFGGAGEMGMPTSKRFSFRLVLRALKRHWWQIALIWGVLSTVLVTVAYLYVKPVYEAIAWLRVEPPAVSVFGPAQASGGGESGSPLQNFSIRTEVRLITSPSVLSAALAQKNVRNLPRIQRALDAEAEMRKDLQASIVPDTTLITVAMSSTNSNESVTLVNSVVDSYVNSVKARASELAKTQIKEFEAIEDELAQEIKGKEDQLKKMMGEKDLVDSGSPDGRINEAGVLEIDPDAANGDVLLSIEDYRRYSKALSELDTDLLAAQAQLHRLRAQQPEQESINQDEVNQAVEERLKGDADLVRLENQFEAAQEQVDHANDVMRKSSDPAFGRARERVRKLKGDYLELKERKRKTYEALVMASIIAPDTGFERELRAAEALVERLKDERDGLEDNLKKMRVRAKSEGIHRLEVGFLSEDLSHVRDRHRRVSSLVQQLEYDVKRNQPRVTVLDKARTSPLPTSDSRKLLMASSPVLVFLGVLGLFTLIELKAGRVANPEDLPSRVRVGVIGVVPPLPSSRGMLSNSPAKLRRRVEEFIQSMDHLRVTLCAGIQPGGAPGRRMVMITSACGSEGKTTLAVQLAGRCANAGLSTLLVDADLRRPRLGELLEVPEGPGLVDVLAGEANPESAMVVIGNAGGFHLLPAGSIGHDPSRLLQGERLARLMAQLRESFDVVIVDAPPVLAVPDALLIGRWTDGAVLAVRHDTSRFPLVERANKRLASVGVPVLGAVVNGVRGSESAYGGYYASYAYASTSAGTTEAPGAAGGDDLS